MIEMKDRRFFLLVFVLFDLHFLKYEQSYAYANALYALIWQNAFYLAFILFARAVRIAGMYSLHRSYTPVFPLYFTLEAAPKTN